MHAFYDLILSFLFYALNVTIHGISTLPPDAIQTPPKHHDMLLDKFCASSAKSRDGPTLPVE